MDEEILFRILKGQTKSTLIELLSTTYYEANTRQRNSIFGNLVRKSKTQVVSSKNVIKKMEVFYKDSLSGVYFAPFDINSKNYSDIPEETDEWFDKVYDFLQFGTQLTKKNDYLSAIKIFEMLYELIERMEDGEEIVYADECGSWMIPGNEKEHLSSYILSLAKVNKPEEYAKLVIPLIVRDSYSSFYNKVYSAAIKHSSKEQRKFLKDELITQNVRIK